MCATEHEADRKEQKIAVSFLGPRNKFAPCSEKVKKKKKDINFRKKYNNRDC